MRMFSKPFTPQTTLNFFPLFLFLWICGSVHASQDVCIEVTQGLIPQRSILEAFHKLYPIHNIQLFPCSSPSPEVGYQISITQAEQPVLSLKRTSKGYDTVEKRLVVEESIHSGNVKNALVKAAIKSEIDSVLNFKPEVNFRDVTPLMGNPELLQSVIDLFKEHYQDKKIEAVAGLEARGFYFGIPLALALKVPFIPIRKQGKLPTPTHVSPTYKTEYDASVMEISTPPLNGKTILIVDDLLALGGTLSTAEALLKEAQAGKLYSTCLIELTELGGRNKLKSEFTSLLKY